MEPKSNLSTVHDDRQPVLSAARGDRSNPHVISADKKNNKMAANRDAQRTYSPTNKEIPIKISPQMFRKSTIPTSVGEEASQ